MTCIRRWAYYVRFVFMCCSAGTVFSMTAPVYAEEVSLPVLLAFAERHAPILQRAIRQRGYGDAADAGAAPLLRHNPTLSFGIGPRFEGSGDKSLDFYVSLQQPIEVAGERGLRRDAASYLSAQLDAEAMEIRWRIRREVKVAFGLVVVARQRELVASQLVHFSTEMVTVARRRLAAGDASAMDVQVAEIDLAQAQQARLVAEQELRLARIDLAEVTGWSIDTPPMVTATLQAPQSVPTLSAVMRVAADRHPALRERRAAVEGALTRTKLANRVVWPTPVLGVQLTHEGSATSRANYIVLGTIGLSLPLWQINQEERARAKIDADVARADQHVTTRMLHSRIARAHAALISATQRWALYTSTVSPSLQDHLARLRRGFEAGELPLLTVTAARDRFFQAQRDALSIYADYYRALADLEFAAGTVVGGVS